MSADLGGGVASIGERQNSLRASRPQLPMHTGSLRSLFEPHTRFMVVIYKFDGSSAHLRGNTAVRQQFENLKWRKRKTREASIQECELTAGPHGDN